MADFLSAMKLASERRVRHARRHRDEAKLRDAALSRPPTLPLRLSDDGFDVLAEIKRRAPSDARGPVRGSADPGGPDGLVGRLVGAYVAGGAAAISVVTEPLAFDGSLDDLAFAAAVMDELDGPIPLMRKDFIVSPLQLLEARAAGAGGVLLIADMLTDAEAQPLLAAAAETGLWLLIEAFDEGHLARAARWAREVVAAGGHALVGVNSRDLRTLDVDRDRFARMAALLPSDLAAVAESGLRGPGDAAAVVACGFRMALVGSSLVAATDPRAELDALLREGRRAAGGATTRRAGCS